MSPIETIAVPKRNKISIAVPKEYSAYSFQVILVPMAPVDKTSGDSEGRPRKKNKMNFIDALLSCPRLDEGEELDISRDSCDFGREISL